MIRRVKEIYEGKSHRARKTAQRITKLKNQQIPKHQSGRIPDLGIEETGP